MEDVFSVKSEFLDNKLTSNGLRFRLFKNTRVLYKQHFYKLFYAEIGKKSSKF